MEPITATIFLNLFLRAAAPALGKVLAETVGVFADSCIRERFSSGLPQTVQENSRYQEAMEAYFQKDIQLEEQRLQAEQEFNQQLFKLLGEWQVNANQNKLTEIQNDWDKNTWFSKLNRCETEKILGNPNHGLLILTSNPNISKDCPPSFRNNLGTEIRNGIELFLHKYYLSKAALVQFYGDYFNASISKLDVNRLHPILGALPTAILYSEITDYQVNLHIGYWGIHNDSIVQYSLPAWDWEKACLEIQKVEQIGEKLAYRQIRQAIVRVHELLAGFITDWYYLNINLFYTPQLFQLSSTFSAEWIKPFIEQLDQPYKLNQAEIHYKHGLQLVNLKRYSEAVLDFDRSLEFRPGFEEAIKNKNLILPEAQKMDEHLIPPRKRRNLENP